MLRGSYYNGFAPRDGMPLYPSLWTGCVGSWEPGLGTSGLVLRDWCGLKNHADFQNLTAANGWTLSQGRYAASLAASSTNRILCTAPVLSGTGDFTISAWVNPISLSGTINEFYIAGNYGASNTTGVEINGYNGKFGCYCSSGATFFSTATLSTGVWTHVAATRQAGTISLYLNGVFDSSATRSGSIGTSRNWCIGNGPDYTAGHGGLIDSVMAHTRALNPNEIAMLARRRGIAYDMMPMPMLYSEQAGFQAAWALRQTLILGGGGGLG